MLKASLFISILMLQFYLAPSGNLQLSHIILLLTAVTTALLYVFKYKTIIFSLNKSKPLLLLIIFILYATISNVHAYFALGITDTLRNLSYWYYSLIIYVCFLIIFEIDRNKQTVSDSILFSNIVIFLTLISGLGGYIFDNRFNAFFNDPNQLAYWIMCSFCCFHFLKTYRSPIYYIICITLALVCIGSSQSRSALLGMIPILIGMTVNQSTHFNKFYKKNKKLLIIVSFFILSGTIFFFLRSDLHDRILKTDLLGELRLRGYARIIEYKNELISGSGQGGDKRYLSIYEVHSSWIGILFYYGIVNFLVFCSFIFLLIRKLKLGDLLIFLGPVVYGFCTYGLRSPMYWIFLAAVTVAPFSGYDRLRNNRIEQN